MSDTKVGVLIDETAKRDAIHIAVAPVVSDWIYPPGEHVGFTSDGRVGAVAKNKIGIIDPFLKEPVKQNQRCWIFLYPQTVTGIRHHWSHPSFNETGPAGKPSMSESEMFLRVYAKEVNGYDEDPEAAFQRLLKGLKTGEMVSHGSTYFQSLSSLENPDKLRHHAETYLGIKINWEDYTFRCSC